MSALVEKTADELAQFRIGISLIRHFRLSYLRKVFSLISRKEKIALVVLFLAVFVSGIVSLRHGYNLLTVPVAASGGTYAEGVLGQPRYINPIYATTDADRTLAQLIFSSLYHYDQNGELVPDLAESMPTVSEDQKEYTVKLKQNIKWHNGDTFTADDVVFTIASIQNTETKSPLQNQWLNTLAQKVDDYTITFSNTEISGPFIHNLTLPIMHQGAWADVAPADFPTSDNNLKPIGTGPYTLTEIAQQTNKKILSVSLSSFKDYYAGQPHIDTVTLRFLDSYEELVTSFHSDEIDGAGIVPLETNATISGKQNSATAYTVPLAQYQAVFFNLRNSYLADKAVRKALLAATDRDKLNHEILEDRARTIYGPFINEHLTLGSDSQTADVAAAEKLLDDAGWKKDANTGFRTKNNVELKFVIATNDTSSNVKAAEFLAESWKAIGVNASVNSMQSKDLTSSFIRPRTFDILVFAQQLGADPDPFLFWHSTQAKDPGLNITGFNNTEADRLISQARTSIDDETRSARYTEFTNLLREEVPAIFLNQSVYLYTVDSIVKNINLNVLYDPIFRFNNISSWYINESRDWK